MPEITLTLSDEEHQKYLSGLAAAQALNYEKKKILIVFNSPGGCPIPMVRAAVPEPAGLRSNGLAFRDRSDYESHRRFYRQAMVDVGEILRGGRP